MAFEVDDRIIIKNSIATEFNGRTGTVVCSDASYIGIMFEGHDLPLYFLHSSVHPSIVHSITDNGVEEVQRWLNSR